MIHEVVNGENRYRGGRSFVEHFALLLDEAGMPRMPARVFAAILAEDAGRLTARELAEPALGQPRRGLGRRPLPRPRPGCSSAGASPAPASTTTGSTTTSGTRPTPTAAQMLRALGAGDGRGRRGARPRARRRAAGCEETREFFAFLQRGAAGADGALARPPSAHAARAVVVRAPVGVVGRCARARRGWWPRSPSSRWWRCRRATRPGRWRRRTRGRRPGSPRGRRARPRSPARSSCAAA